MFDTWAYADYKQSIIMNTAIQILRGRLCSQGMFVCLWAITYAPRDRNGPR